MSGYFSNFSLNKLTDSIANAAQKTQDTLSSAVANVNLNDPQTRLSFKARTRYLKETLGAVDEISKLPEQYILLEKKSDALEKTCKRMLVVSQTFEVEGYDYPPNLSESFSDWWSTGKDGWFGGSKKSSDDDVKGKENDQIDTFMPRSFSQAISKASHECGEIYEHAQNCEKKPLDDDDDEINLVKMFNTLSICYKNIDEGKDEMDRSIAREFNKQLEKLINEDFKEIHVLRNKVENSRLKFDTIRYEMRLKEKEQTNAQVSEESRNGTDTEPNANKEDKPADAVESAEPASNGTKAASREPLVQNPEDNKLLEQLEDEFVSNTSEAVETMGSITEGTEILSLMKVFQNLQLVYYRQCVQETEASLKTLNGLEIDES
ncbi:YPR148C [Zygosaccharomyces parabailii]|uniref:ZYBA0S03-01574g1_1 n=1 Tax=Zygosaccharomyces bailii (strain CLIB 213 / ATCC 58445 / CBS 680 / BCRC 21525 / NBRC 1098 / NCYC 1416 / NRRL Y-2227) TaxID=1333698 RepID=A0A8J2T4G5_ZYGB2|nr:YPR148C [Zygosaccharomyces parabailii]CDF88771.1 ZYBA0S03-01574g1_1 [Zygosaccharomyces bailii CLIB 213]SJM82742.1 uncharacterized protein ZBIST_0637 [Zygosaccharomyces bailii]